MSKHRPRVPCLSTSEKGWFHNEYIAGRNRGGSKYLEQTMRVVEPQFVKFIPRIQHQQKPNILHNHVSCLCGVVPDLDVDNWNVLGHYEQPVSCELRNFILRYSHSFHDTRFSQGIVEVPSTNLSQSSIECLLWVRNHIICYTDQFMKWPIFTLMFCSEG